jgi:hypothetical protein
MAEHPFAKHLTDKEPSHPEPKAEQMEVRHSPDSTPIEQPQGHPFAKSHRRARQRSAILTVAIIALIVGGSFLFFSRRNRGGILLQVQDKQSLTVTLNGRAATVRNHSLGLFIPAYAGRYRIRVEKPEFTPFSQDIEVQKGKTTVLRPAFALLPKENQADKTTTIDYVRPSQDGKALFYLGNNRQIIYRMEVANRIPVPITEKALKGVSDIQWSGQPDVALVTQADGAYLQEIPRYDFRNQSLVKIGGKELVSPIWDPTNPERIAAAYFTSAGERTLIFADKRLTQIDRKVDLKGFENPKLVWSPDASYIAVINRSSDYTKNNLWIYTTADGNFRQATSEGNVLNASFSPDSTVLLYESYTSDSGNPYGAVLASMKSDGSARYELSTVGRVAQAAWKNDSSFYLPDLRRSNLLLYTAQGRKETLSFSFADPRAVQGMFYSPQDKVLLFYTTQAIYTVNLSE